MRLYTLSLPGDTNVMKPTHLSLLALLLAATLTATAELPNEQYGVLKVERLSLIHI